MCRSGSSWWSTVHRLFNIVQSLKHEFALLSETDKMRFAHYRLEANWYHWIFKRIYKFEFKFVSASFKSYTFGAECISMWPLCSYRFNLNISCWLIKKLSSKYNTSINLMTYFSSRTTGKFEFLPAEGCACLISRRIWVFVFAGTKWEKPEPKSRTKIFKIQKKV